MNARYKWFLIKSVRFLVISYLVLTLVFMLPRMMPGDPIENLFGEQVTRVDDDVRASLEERYGLDQPLWNQYVTYLSSILSFDFGYSISLSMEVTPLIEQRIVWTVMMMLPSVLIGSFVSLYLATKCGLNRGGKADGFFSFMAVLIHTVPGFLIAMLFVRFFSFQLKWFPLGHLSSGNYTGFMGSVDILYHLLLPISVLSILITSSLFLVLRNSITQINDDYFIFVARSKGLTEEDVGYRHVMRNVMPTFLSILAMNLGFMISGALLIEIVFSIQGMGVLLYNAITMQDYPVIQAVFVILTISVLFANFLAELLYGIVDPRVGDRSSAGVGK